MINTMCGAQWINRAQNVIQKTKFEAQNLVFKPKTLFWAQFPEAYKKFILILLKACMPFVS